MKPELQFERIEKQLNKIFVSLDSKWVKTSFILSKLELPINVELKRNKFSLESFIKLYLYKRIKGITTYPYLIKKLDENDLNNLNIIDIPKKRTFNEFFQKRLTEEHIQFLDNLAENILSTATKHNIILDIEIVKETITKKKKEVNKKNKAFKEAVKLVKKLVYPQIEIKLKHNAKFTTRDLLDVLVHTAQTHDFCTKRLKLLMS